MIADGKVLLYSARAGLLRRAQGNYKVSFHCINLLYLTKLALVNRT